MWNINSRSGTFRFRSEVCRCSRINLPRFAVAVVRHSFNLEGGVAAFINFARAAQSNDPTLAQFLEAWDGLDPQAQEDPSQADALCRRLRLSPLEVLRAVVQEAVEFCALTSGLMAYMALPEMVETPPQDAA
jgi:hypothetical protein